MGISLQLRQSRPWPSFTPSPRLEELAFWLKPLPNVYWYNKSQLELHPQLCLCKSAWCRCKQAAASLLFCCGFFFPRGDSALLAVLGFSSSLPSPLSRLPFNMLHLADRRWHLPPALVALCWLWDALLPPLASSQQQSSLLLPINFPVGKNILGLPSEPVLLLVCWLLPCTEISCVSTEVFKKPQQKQVDLLAFQAIALHCRGENLQQQMGGDTITPLHLLNLHPATTSCYLTRTFFCFPTICRSESGLIPKPAIFTSHFSFLTDLGVFLLDFTGSISLFFIKK